MQKYTHAQERTHARVSVNLHTYIPLAKIHPLAPGSLHKHIHKLKYTNTHKTDFIPESILLRPPLPAATSGRPLPSQEGRVKIDKSTVARMRQVLPSILRSERRGEGRGEGSGRGRSNWGEEGGEGGREEEAEEVEE